LHEQQQVLYKKSGNSFLSFVPVSFHFEDSRERWLSCSWIAKNDTSENVEPTKREGKWTMADQMTRSKIVAV
jgi:hypothetical protein